MAKKSSFQKELERLASKQIITVIGIGCLFFCVAIFGNTLIERHAAHINAILVKGLNQHIFRGFPREKVNRPVQLPVLGLGVGVPGKWSATAR